MWADALVSFRVVALGCFYSHAIFLLMAQNDPEHKAKLLVSGIMTFQLALKEKFDGGDFFRVATYPQLL